MRTGLAALWLLAGAGAAVVIRAQNNGLVEWTDYGGNLTGSRYSAVADIGRANLGQLNVAWEWRSPDRAMPGATGGAATVPGNFNSTPLMLDNVVYLTTPFGSVAAK